MKKLTLNYTRPNKYYSKILLYLTICIVITILILSSILYINFEGIALSLIDGYIKDSLTQVSFSASFMVSSAKTVALQAYFDNDITNLMYYSSSHIMANPSIQSAGINRLVSYRNVTPFIQSIYVYNGMSDGGIYTSFGTMETVPFNFYDQGIFEILKNIKLYKKNSFIVRRIPNLLSDKNHSSHANVYTYLFFDSPVDSGIPSEAIVLNLSEDWMRKTMDSINTNPSSDAFIIDNKGTTVIGNKKYTMLTDLSNQEYIKKVLSSQKSSGSFIADVSGTKSVISFVSSNILNWRFIQITPYKSVMSKINNLKVNTFLFVTIFLLIGLFASFILSRRLYLPLDKVITQLSSLETEKRNNFHINKQDFLRNSLLLGTNINYPYISEKFNEFRIGLKPIGSFFILLIRIDYFYNFCNSYSLEDRSLYKFSIMNIASELSSEISTNEAIDVGEDHIIIVLNTNESDIVELDIVINIIQKIQNAVYNHLNISITATISATCDSLINLKSIYASALDASKYRLILGHKSIIHAKKIDAFKFASYIYPVEKEKQLSDALMLNKFEEAKLYFSEIIKSTYERSDSVINSTILRLALSINSTIETLEKTNGLNLNYSFSNFITQLNRLETISEVSDLFYEIINVLSEKIELKKSNKYDNLVSNIKNLVETNYSNCNFTSDFIAEKIQMSPVYLSRLFKKLTTLSLSDYITQHRLEKAKDMLVKTELPISQIMENTGFISKGNFYTLFKKEVGLTPSEYRSSMKKKQQK